MTLIEQIWTGAALAMDAAAASALLGASGLRLRQRLCAALTFGAFQAAMPLIGFALGSAVYRQIERVDHWVAFGLLLLMGLQMLLEKPDEAGPQPVRITARTLVTLGLATSVDALAVGVSLAMDRADPWQTAGVIGGVTVLICLAAARFGRKLGARFGARAQRAGGGLLIALGANILWQHLTGA